MHNRNFVKRVITWILICMISIGLFTACNERKSKEVQKPQDTVASTAAPGESSSQLPIVAKPLTLKMWAPMFKAAGTMNDFNGKVLYQEKEKLTGIHIDFIHPPVGQEKDQLRLMVASNELPDMILSSYVANLEPNEANAIVQKQIQPLNDIVEKHAPNYAKLIKEYPNLKAAVSTDAGELLGFACADILDAPSAGGLIIRKDWVEKLKLKIPETIDEWETVLSAFRDKDPNGNGKADEIPFAVRRDIDFVGFATAWGMEPHYFYMEGGIDGNVKFGAIEPACKDFVIKMADWYAKGIFDKNILTSDEKLLNANVTSNRVGASTNVDMDNLNSLMEKDPNFLMWPAPIPKLNSSSTRYYKSNSIMRPTRGGGKVLISGSCKYPVEAAKWLDFNYSDKGQLLYNFGKEGLSYNMIDSYPVYSDNIWKNPEGISVSAAIAKYCMANDYEGFVLHPAYLDQNIGATPAKRQSTKTWALPKDPGSKNNLSYPPATLTAAEAAEDNRRMNDINTYVKEMLFKFIVGAEPIGNWDKFVNQLKTMGIEKSIKIRQDALQRWKKNVKSTDLKLAPYTPNFKNAKLNSKKGYEYLDADLK